MKTYTEVEKAKLKVWEDLIKQLTEEGEHYIPDFLDFKQYKGYCTTICHLAKLTCCIFQNNGECTEVTRQRFARLEHNSLFILDFRE